MLKEEFREALVVLDKVIPSSLQIEKFQVERVKLLATIYEKRGQYYQAQRYLNEIIGKVDGVFDVSLRIFLSRLKLKAGEFESGKEELAELEKTINGKIDDSLKEEFLRTKAELLFKNGEKIAALNTYMVLLEEFEPHRPMNSIRYKAGKILLQEGDFKGAEKVWGRFQGKDKELYRRMAKENLRHRKWMREYKRYIQMVTQL